MNKVLAIILTVLGGIGEVYALMTINSEKNALFGYSYTAPFTEHEIFFIALAVVSAILLIIGLVGLVAKKKNDTTPQ